MARPPSPHPTDAELEILKILWDSGPSELGQIRSGLSRQRAVAATTVATTLKVMMEKGLVERLQGVRGYLWSPLVNRKTAASGLLRRLMDRAFNGSAGELVAHLVEEGELSAGDREEILRLLKESQGSKDAHSRKKS